MGMEKMIKELRKDLEELEKTIKLLDIQLAKIKVEYAVGEVSGEAYMKEKETLELGLSLLKNELNKIKEILESTVPTEVMLPKERIRMILEEIPMERAFYFYNDFGQYTEKYSRSLEEFVETVSNVSSRSLRFHLAKGDFQIWIRDLGDPKLALVLDGLKKLELDDKELRNRIHECVKERIESLKRSLETYKSFE